MTPFKEFTMSNTEVRSVFERIDDTLTTLARHKIAHMMVYGMSLMTLILGIVLMLGEVGFSGVPTFSKTFEIMPPFTWGVVFAGTAVLLALSFFLNKPTARLPGLVLVILYSIFSTTSWYSANQDGNGIFSAAVAYGGIAYFGVIVVLVCGVERK